ncbi:MAG: hypothetical protein WCC14_19545 [Acidobacteriaceae bacterium]
MPGYLSHLALRVSASRPAVRPRIPSLFESLPGAGITGDPAASGLRVVDQERVAPPAPMAALWSDAQNPFSPHPTVREPLTTLPEPQSVPHEPPRRQAPEIVPEAVTIAAPRQPERTVEAIAEEPAPLQAPRHVVIRPEVRSVSAVEESRQAESRAPAPLREAEPPRGLPAEAQERPSVRLQPKDAAVESRRTLSETISALPAPAIRPAPQYSPHAEVRPAPRNHADAAPGSQEEPSVQVTIGRLIVEAVMPAPAAPLAPRPRATGPRLSLDDYLSQRRSQA